MKYFRSRQTHLTCSFAFACLCGWVSWTHAQTNYSVNPLTLAGSLDTPYSYVDNPPFTQDGLHFSGRIMDYFGQVWLATADFQSNNQIVFQFSCQNNGNGNIAGTPILYWHFWGLGFPIEGLQPVVAGQAWWGTDDRSIPSFDQNNIWMGFSALANWAPYNYYVYQVLPVPEPTVSSLLVIGVVLALCPICWRGTGTV